MVLAVEHKESAGRRATFFSVRRDFAIENFSRYGETIGGFNLRCENPALDEILPLDDTAVRGALDTAFNGQPSQVRFLSKSDGRFYSYELYCFPNVGSKGGSIGCLLADRCKEEEDSAKLQAKINELDIINQAVRAFAETKNLNEILKIILLAVTAGPGLGFNRGFILLSDETGSYLHGCLATGPSSAEEAGVIWRSLSEKPLTLEQVLRLYRSDEITKDIHVNKLVASLKVPLVEDSNFIARSIKGRCSLIVGPEMMIGEADKKLQAKFGVDYMAVVPLNSLESLQGVILADNMITRRPISLEDLKLLEILARYASDAIENTRLYSRLQRKIARLKEANETIIRSRENLIRAEKLSSVSKMALDVAHEIRNPLTVIGGHANAQRRRTDVDDRCLEVFDIISDQAARIESTLDRFSSVVSLCEKEEGKFNLVDLTREALGMLATPEMDNVPILTADDKTKDSAVFVDQALFYEAMMVIFKEASSITAGLGNIVVDIERHDNSAMIFIGGGDKCDKLAEIFYSVFRAGKGEPKSREMAVALEILRHYGGDIGIGSSDDKPGRLFVEFPICGEDS